MRETSIPILFLVGLASAFLGDQVVRLDEALHHAGAAHLVHTALLALPAGVGVALLLREDAVALAALVAGAGWLTGLGVLALAG